MEPIINKTGQLFSISQWRGASDIYLETGTCYGESLVRAFAHFSEYYSVEVYEPFYRHCQEKFKFRKDVVLYLGKSYEKLPEMLADIGGRRSVIFLDAHPAGPNTGGHDDLMAKGVESEYQQDLI